MSSKRHITATLADTRWEFKRCCVCAGTGSRRALMGSRHKTTLSCRECRGTGYLRSMRPLSRETRQERPTWQPGKARTLRVTQEDGK